MATLVSCSLDSFCASPVIDVGISADVAEEVETEAKVEAEVDDEEEEEAVAVTAACCADADDAGTRRV